MFIRSGSVFALGTVQHSSSDIYLVVIFLVVIKF